MIKFVDVLRLISEPNDACTVFTGTTPFAKIVYPVEHTYFAKDAITPIPVGPVFPVGPVPPRPVGPVDPVEPLDPVIPVLPVKPVAPRPVGPVDPVGPVEPDAPVVPVVPVGPVSLDDANVVWRCVGLPSWK